VRYTYKDFVTGKIKHTRGTFAGWSEPTGPLNVPYAIFVNPKGQVCVPEYLLTRETREAIKTAEAPRQQPERRLYRCNECKLDCGIKEINFQQSAVYRQRLKEHGITY